jgi:thioredoxin-related protein
MKALVFILTSSLLVYSQGWLTDFEQAKQLANQNNKSILLNFSGSDWCGPCIKMKKEIFEQAEFQEFADKTLILVRADFPRHKKNQLDPKQKEHNEKLAERYNPKGKFPLTLLLDANGNVLREWDGYAGSSVGEFVRDITSASHGK